MKTETIFIQIPSYRDPELLTTLRECINNANDPSRLRIGICHQVHSDDDWDDLSEFSNDSRFKIITVDAVNSKGLGWARVETQKLFNNEDYVLQLDSHHRFKQGWDNILINTLNKIKSPKPIITGYLPAYVSGEPVNINSTVSTTLCAMHDNFNHRGLITFIPKHHKHNVSDVWPSRFMCGHFFFTTGDFNNVHEYDPDIYFCGEELRLSVIAFTHGYDMYHMKNPPIWHQYGRIESVKHWDDKNTGVIEVKTKPEQAGLNKLKCLFSQTNNEVFGKSGLGDLRTMLEYEAYASINFQKQSFKECVKHGGPVNQGRPNNSYSNGDKDCIIIDKSKSFISHLFSRHIKKLGFEVSIVSSTISNIANYNNTTFFIVDDGKHDLSYEINSICNTDIHAFIIHSNKVDDNHYQCEYINTIPIRNYIQLDNVEITCSDHVYVSLDIDSQRQNLLRNLQIANAFDILGQLNYDIQVHVNKHVLCESRLKYFVNKYKNINIVKSEDRHRSLTTSKCVVTLYSDDEILAGVYKKPLVTIGYESGKLVKSIPLTNVNKIKDSIISAVENGELGYDESDIVNSLSKNLISLNLINSDFINSIMLSNIPRNIVDNSLHINYLSQLWVNNVTLEGQRIIISAPDLYGSFLSNDIKIPVQFDYSVLGNINNLDICLILEHPVDRFIRKFNMAYERSTKFHKHKSRHPSVTNVLNMVKGRHWNMISHLGLLPQTKVLDGITLLSNINILPMDKISDCGDDFKDMKIIKHDNKIHKITSNEIKYIEKVYNEDMKFYRDAISNYRRRYAT